MPEAGPDARYVGPTDIEKVIALQVDSLQAEIDRRVETIEREARAAAELQKTARHALEQRIVGEARVLNERLNGIDKATEVLNETVNRVPTDLQKAITNMRDVMDEKFASVGQQFQERDTRSERESRDNKVAVDAAFAAQKEAAAKQDESNAKAIDKSEAATTETINKLSELFKSSNDSLSDKIDDLKGRITSIESRAVGVIGEQTKQFQGSLTSSGWLGLVAAVAAILVTLLIAALATHGFTK